LKLADDLKQPLAALERIQEVGAHAFRVDAMHTAATLAEQPAGCVAEALTARLVHARQALTELERLFARSTRRAVHRKPPHQGSSPWLLALG
jgi:hypothetical protein